jgi:hypothetical protein
VALVQLTYATRLVARLVDVSLFSLMEPTDMMLSHSGPCRPSLGDDTLYVTRIGSLTSSREEAALTDTGR